MLYCKLLKEFHENYPEFIELVDTLSTQLSTKESYKTCNMGSSNARLMVDDNSVGFKLLSNDYALCFYSMFKVSDISSTVFYSNQVVTEIQYGKLSYNNTIRLIGENFERTLDYPVQEEQYFQYLTVSELSTEDVYRYFMELDSLYLYDIQLSVQGTGYEQFEELIKDKTKMKTLKNDIDLVYSAYKMTNGLR